MDTVSFRYASLQPLDAFAREPGMQLYGYSSFFLGAFQDRGEWTRLRRDVRRAAEPCQCRYRQYTQVYPLQTIHLWNSARKVGATRWVALQMVKHLFFQAPELALQIERM